MKRIFILLFLIVQLTVLVKAQFAPQQSLYMYNQIALNPGATGKDDALNVALSYRTMWQGIQGAPRTMYATIHTPLKKESISVGFQFYSDRIGISKRNGILLTGAYRIKMYNSELAFGLGAGAIANENNWQDVQTVEQGDRVFTQGNVNYWLPATSAGVYYNSKKAFAGLSVPQMFSEIYAGGSAYKASFNPKYYSVVLNAGRWFSIDKKNRVLAAGLMRYNSASKIQPELSVLYSYDKLFDFGFTYRHKDSAILISRVRINDQFSLGYSYDYVTSELAVYNKGTHEACLLYTFLFKSNSPNTKLF